VSLTEALQQFTNLTPIFNPDYVKQALGGF